MGSLSSPVAPLNHIWVLLVQQTSIFEIFDEFSVDLIGGYKHGFGLFGASGPSSGPRLGSVLPLQLDYGPCGLPEADFGVF